MSIDTNKCINIYYTVLDNRYYIRIDTELYFRENSITNVG